MLKPRTSYLASLAIGVASVVIGKLAVAALKAIYDVTIQDFWKDTIAPFLSEHIGPWSTTMLDWIGPFWAGVICAFAIMFAVEMFFAWRRRQAVKGTALNISNNQYDENSAMEASKLSIDFLFDPTVEPDATRMYVAIKSHKRFTDVGFIGKVGIAKHTIDGANWEWEPTIRFSSSSVLFPSEELEFDLFYRASEDNEYMSLLGKQRYIDSQTDTILALIEFNFSSAEGQHSVRRVLEVKFIKGVMLTTFHDPNQFLWIKG